MNQPEKKKHWTEYHHFLSRTTNEHTFNSPCGDLPLRVNSIFAPFRGILKINLCPQFSFRCLARGTPSQFQFCLVLSRRFKSSGKQNVSPVSHCGIYGQLARELFLPNLALHIPWNVASHGLSNQATRTEESCKPKECSSKRNEARSGSPLEAHILMLLIFPFFSSFPLRDDDLVPTNNSTLHVRLCVPLFTIVRVI